MAKSNRVKHCPYVGNSKIYEEDIIDTAGCTTDKCEFCGWNPAVARRRKETLRNWGANQYKTIVIGNNDYGTKYLVRYMKVRRESPYAKIS